MIPIPGFSDYLISETGEVWSTITNRFSEVKPGSDGYIRVVVVSDSGKRGTQLLDRLLAISFIPNPLDLPLVRHLNDNKSDISLGNLAWGTDADNGMDRSKNRAHLRKLKCPEGHDKRAKANGSLYCLICERQAAQRRKNERV